jgi:anti-sigma factor RsiW
MNDRDFPVTEDELHAYVDGELPADRRAAVEAWLAAHPDDMARVAAWRAQAESIRARYGAVANEPVPARLALERLDRLDRGRRGWRAYAAAAVLAAFLIGGAAGWVARAAWAPAANPFQALTADALEAYRLYVVEVRHPVEVPGSEEAHLVQWLSKRVGYELRCPNLEKIGLKLVGGRLLPGPAGAAAFFMYETASGERFTLYSARSNTPETALRYNAAGRVAAVAWVDNKVAYVISGEANRDRLQTVAKAAYDQLETRKTAKEGT